MAPVLQVRNLRVAYTSRRGDLCPALDGVGFDLAPGEVLGILGESGSGKSTLAAAIPQLLPPNGVIQAGEIQFEGQDLLHARPRELESIRGRRIGLILQEPSSCLHPTIRIGSQISDILAVHKSLDRRSLRLKTMQALQAVFPEDAQRISRSYPHQLSGGQRQRVLIAQSIACEPGLLIADEPTASLDPVTQQEVLQLFRTIRERFALSLLFITHNPLLLSGFADRILVLYAGRVAEIGPASRVLASPKHPYASALLSCLPPAPHLEKSVANLHLPVIQGEPPDLSLHAHGCRFEPRCGERMDICKKDEPEAFSVSEAHDVSCFRFVT